MACFLAPAAEAVVTTVLQKKLDQKEKEAEHGSIRDTVENAQSIQESTKPKHKISWSRKLKWLNTMLWGGSALLCVEHVYGMGKLFRGRRSLPAMQTPSEIVPMLKEIALYGTTMAVVITGVWFGMTLIAERLTGKLDTEERAEQEVSRMHLILTAAAAIAATLVWPEKLPDRRYRLGFLSLMSTGGQH